MSVRKRSLEKMAARIPSGKIAPRRRFVIGVLVKTSIGLIRVMMNTLITG